MSRFRGEPDISSLTDLLLLHSAFLKRSHFYFVLQPHEVHDALQNFFLALYQLVRPFFRIKWRRKRFEGLTAYNNECAGTFSIGWSKFTLICRFLINGKTNTLFFLSTQPVKHSSAQEGGQVTSSSVFSQRKVMFNDYQWFFLFFYIKDPLRYNKKWSHAGFVLKHHALVEHQRRQKQHA